MKVPSLSRSVVVLSVWARIAEEGFRLSSCESLGLSNHLLFVLSKLPQILSSDVYKFLWV